MALQFNINITNQNAQLIAVAVGGLCATICAMLVLQRKSKLSPRQKLQRAVSELTNNALQEQEATSAELAANYCPGVAFVEPFNIKDALFYYDKLAILAELNTPALLDYSGERGPPVAMDLGCGLGGLAFKLATCFPSVVALDSNADKIARAQVMKDIGQEVVGLPVDHVDTIEVTAKLPEDVDPARVTFRCADVTQLPPNIAPVDCLVMSLLIEHLQSPMPLLNRIKDLITPMGVAIICTTYTPPRSRADASQSSVQSANWAALGASSSRRSDVKKALLRVLSKCGLRLRKEETLPRAVRLSSWQCEVHMVDVLVFGQDDKYVLC